MVLDKAIPHCGCTHFPYNFEAHLNILFNIKVKMVLLIMIISPPPPIYVDYCKFTLSSQVTKTPFWPISVIKLPQTPQVWKNTETFLLCLSLSHTHSVTQSPGSKLISLLAAIDQS